MGMLVERIKGSSPDDRLQQILTSTKLNFFTSVQGEVLVRSLDGTFDKVEAAANLHFRLVDQNHFSTVLKGLDDQADRENVLHRVATEKSKRKKLPVAETAAANTSTSNPVME